MLETLVFDMGNVLVHFSHEKMCAQIGALCGWSPPEARTRLLDSGWQAAFERGLKPPAQIHCELEAELGRPIDLAALRHAASDIFVLNTPIVPILDQLIARGHRLVLLSNTSLWHFEIIRKTFSVLERFDDFVLSCDVQAMKPEPAIFEAVVAKLQCPPRRAFYTEDLAAYVAAGRTHGLHAEIFTDVPALVRHLTARGVSLDPSPA
jgi:putative hydrolase of the HAD superfamily